MSPEHGDEILLALGYKPAAKTTGTGTGKGSTTGGTTDPGKSEQQTPQKEESPKK